MTAKIKITQTSSAIGRKPGQRDTLKALGLNKIDRASVVDDTPSIRGMVRKVAHLLRVENQD